MNEPLFLGIDGGGTSCKARLCRADGTVLSETKTGAANTLLGSERAMAAIELAAERVLELAGMAPERIATVHVGAGLAGLSLAREQQRLSDLPHRFAGFAADTDAYIACLGAYGGGDGGVLIAGTGSCAGLIMNGRFSSIGGWGFQLSDQGSGAAMGRQAFRRALLGHDRIKPQTAMGDWIMHEFGHSPEALVVWAETAEPGDYGAFAPRIFDFANDDDEAAIEIANTTANDLTDLVDALISRGIEKVCLIGGLSEPIKAWMPAHLRTVLGARQGDSLNGALILARRTFQSQQSAEQLTVDAR